MIDPNEAPEGYLAMVLDGSAVRVQVHFAPMWPVQFWMAFWQEVMK